MAMMSPAADHQASYPSQHVPTRRGFGAMPLLAAAVLLPLGLTALASWSAWQDAWRNAHTQATHAAEAGAEYVGRVLDGHRMAVDRINDLLRGLPDAEIRAREAELHAVLRALIADTPQLQTAYVLDRHGRFLVSAGVYPVPDDVDMSDREHHALLAGPNPPDVAVTRVYRGRMEDNLFFAVARRRKGTGNRDLPPGAFDGQANVSVDPVVVGEGLRRLFPQPGDSIALVRGDGEVLARSLGYDRPPPIRLPPDSPMRAAFARGEERGTLYAPSGIDGVLRLAVQRKVEGWPVHVVAGRPRNAVVAAWRRATLGHLAVGLPATLLLSALALSVQRQRRKLAQANDELELRVLARTAELTAREHREREVLHSLGEVFYALDSAGRVRFASRLALATWGRTEAEVLGRDFAEVYPLATTSIAWPAQLGVLADRQEVHLCLPSPRTGHWLEMDAYPAADGGVTLAFRDIEDRRRSLLDRVRAEAVLRESEERFRLVAESAPVMLWMGDETGKCLYLNRALREFWGVAPDAIAGFEWAATLHPEDAAHLFAAFAQGMGAQTGFQVEARYRRADGAWRVLLAEARPRFGPDGAFLGMIGVNVDVTETREAEAALRASEQRLRLAQEAGGIGAWEHDLRSGARHWSDSMYRLWGIAPDTPVGIALIDTVIHPEDRLRVRDAVRAASNLLGPLPPLEFRILRPCDGELRWLHSQAEATADANGQPLRQIGIMRDITEQKAAMERLELLMRELDHRAKNALAVVQAAVRLTSKADPQGFAEAIEGRVAALARAHALLAQGRWSGARLRMMMESELAGFLPAGTAQGAAAPHVVLDGPELSLSPAATQSLSMAVHELATNATKHGALSVPGGELRVTWRIEQPGGTLHLRWEERGGPPVTAPPSRRGFGSRVIEATMRNQLGGTMERHWEEAGLVCDFTLPLSRILSSAEAPERAA
jgi:PAS domain S-box-containing protein